MGSRPVMALAADGQVLDHRYRLDRWMASGQVGDVWLATDLLLDRPVAVKLLSAEMAADAAVLAKFTEEARRGSSVTHENIVRVFDYNDAIAPQTPFLVMEFVDGPSLADMLLQGPLGLDTALDILAQVAAGLDAAHRAGLTHLDLQPANVLLTADGTAKVTSVRVAKPTGTGRAGTGPVAGAALGYLSPEYVLAARGTLADDLYSLGVMADECLRGESRSAAVPPEVSGLITALTDADPAQRPGSAAEVAERASALRAQFTPPSRKRQPDMVAALGRSTAPMPAVQVQATQVPHAQVPDAQIPNAQVPQRRRSRGRLPFVLVAAAVVLAVALVAAGHIDGDRLPAQNAIQAGRASAQVNAAALRNRPVSSVDSRLRRMGFRVRNRWRSSATVTPGLVITVWPTGRLPLGSVVTVLGSSPTGGSGQVRLSRPARKHHRSGSHHAKHGGQGGHASHNPSASPPPSARPTPTPTSTPSPTGTPSPAPSQSSTGSPPPSGSPSGTSNPSPANAAALAPNLA